MALVSVSNISLKGVACAVPTALDRNSDYPFISKEQKEKLFKVTGIESKRIVKGNSTTSDLCFSAAEKLLKKIDWKPETVDVLLFVAQTRDYIVPSTAPILQHRLGLTTRCIAFDIPLGCSGYVYGLSVAGLFLNNNHPHAPACVEPTRTADGRFSLVNHRELLLPMLVREKLQ